jgi:[ribosomal protein S5]-alanine N-acetyltransferase
LPEPRLRSERPWREHARLYRDLFGDPRVASALWPGAAPDRARGQDILSADIEHWERRSFGPWVFFESATGVFVGRGGLRATIVTGSECVELLYAVRPDAWGRGYATEMALISVERARQLRIAEVVGLVAGGNNASRRVLEKAGMRLREELEHAGLPHRLGRLRTVH